MSILLGTLAVILLWFLHTPLCMAALCAALVFGMVRYILKGSNMKSGYKWVLFGGILCGNLFLVIYTHFQNFLPFWDYAGYYLETLRSASLMHEDLVGFFKTLYESMLKSDYTKLPTLFTAPILEMLGGSFTAYIFTIYNLFIVPFYCIFAGLVYRVNKRCVWLIFLFTPFLNPALRGYLDAAGLLYIGVWLSFIYKDDFQKMHYGKDIALGLLSVLFVFTRRWYLFFLVGAFISLFFVGVIRKLRHKQYRLDMLLYNLLLIGGVTLLMVLLFFRPYLVRLFTNRMQDAYSAYMFGDFWWNIKYFINYYGILPFLFFALGLFGLTKEKTRWFTLFLLLQSIAMFLLFTRIQTISYHHQYLFAANLFLLAAIGIRTLPKMRRTSLAAWLLVLSVSFVYIYVPFSLTAPAHLLSSKRFVPKTADTEGVLKLRDKLSALSGGNDTIYILSSSELFNDDMMKNSGLPQNEEGLPGLLGTAHVDKRDGFPNHFFVAKYIVAVEPVQTHLGEENQQVVAYLAREVLDGTYTDNLREIDSVEITNGVFAHIYQRERGYSVMFLDRVKKHFQTLYPEHPFLYDIDYIWSQN